MTEERDLPGGPPRRIPREEAERRMAAGLDVASDAPTLRTVMIVDGLTVSPGDSLLIVVKEDMAQENLEFLHEALKEQLPDTNIVIFNGGALDVIKMPSKIEGADDE